MLQVNKAVETLSASYGGVVASNVFLEAITNVIHVKTSAKDQLGQMCVKFENFTADLNKKFMENNLPLRILYFSSTFSIDFLNKSHTTVDSHNTSWLKAYTLASIPLINST